jgi:hypothetical protein
MVCPSVWIRRLRHYKRSGLLPGSIVLSVGQSLAQMVWPFVVRRAGEGLEKRSVLLAGFVVFVTGSVISREVWPFVDWPFAGIRRFGRGFAPLTSTLKRSVHLSHSRNGRAASHDKRSVLLSRFVVFFAGSVRSPEVSQEVWPFADWPFAGIRRFCRGFAPLTRGLGICRPLLDSRSGSIYGTGRDSKAAVHLQGPGGTCVAAGRAGG